MVGLLVALDVEQRVALPEPDVSRLAARHLLRLTVAHQQDARQVVGRLGALQTGLALLAVGTLATLGRGARRAVRRCSRVGSETGWLYDWRVVRNA